MPGSVRDGVPLTHRQVKLSEPRHRRAPAPLRLDQFSPRGCDPPAQARVLEEPYGFVDERVGVVAFEQVRPRGDVRNATVTRARGHNRNSGRHSLGDLVREATANADRNNCDRRTLQPWRDARDCSRYLDARSPAQTSYASVGCVADDVKTCFWVSFSYAGIDATREPPNCVDVGRIEHVPHKDKR